MTCDSVMPREQESDQLLSSASQTLETFNSEHKAIGGADSAAKARLCGVYKSLNRSRNEQSKLSSPSELTRGRVATLPASLATARLCARQQVLRALRHLETHGGPPASGLMSQAPPVPRLLRPPCSCMSCLTRHHAAGNTTVTDRLAYEQESAEQATAASQKMAVGGGCRRSPGRQMSFRLVWVWPRLFKLRTLGALSTLSCTARERRSGRLGRRAAKELRWLGHIPQLAAEESSPLVI